MKSSGESLDLVVREAYLSTFNVRYHSLDVEVLRCKSIRLSRWSEVGGACS